MCHGVMDICLEVHEMCQQIQEMTPELMCGLNQSQLVATLWLPQPQSPSNLQILCEAPLAALAGAEEEQNNVEWIPKLNAHAQSILGSIQHCFAPLEPSRGQQEEPHTQFARRMETKVVVATNVAISWDCLEVPFKINWAKHVELALVRCFLTLEILPNN